MSEIMSAIRRMIAMRVSAKTMRLIRPFVTVQFVIFLALGFLNTLTAVICATALDLIKPYIFTDATALGFVNSIRLTFIIGYAVSIVQSFFLNCRLTFYTKPTLKKFIRFPVSYIPNFLFQYVFMYVFTAAGLNHTAAYLLAAIIGTPITFIVMRLVIQKNS